MNKRRMWLATGALVLALGSAAVAGETEEPEGSGDCGELHNWLNREPDPDEFQHSSTSYAPEPWEILMSDDRWNAHPQFVQGVWNEIEHPDWCS